MKEKKITVGRVTGEDFSEEMESELYSEHM